MAKEPGEPDLTGEEIEETAESRQEVPPQYRDLPSDIVEELWVIAEPVDPKRATELKAWKEAALRKLREAEKENSEK